MKKFLAILSCLSGSELCVYADTKEEARKMAIEDFTSRAENELELVDVKARTERCDICQYTYTPSDVVKENGEELCVYCYQDKYACGELSPADIPF